MGSVTSWLIAGGDGFDEIDGAETSKVGDCLAWLRMHNALMRESVWIGKDEDYWWVMAGSKDCIWEDWGVWDLLESIPGNYGAEHGVEVELSLTWGVLLMLDQSREGVCRGLVDVLLSTRTQRVTTCKEEFKGTKDSEAVLKFEWEGESGFLEKRKQVSWEITIGEL